VQSELMATREQLEEYRLGWEEERESHKRTKANVQSLNQQWQDMHHELEAKKKEVWKKVNGYHTSRTMLVLKLCFSLQSLSSL